MSHEEPKFEQAEQPAGGWGSAEAIGSHLWRERALFRGSRIIFKQNKPDGYACVSCSWAKPAHPHAIEACENGIKATAWEVTARRAPPEFFAEHTVTELLAWSDLELESTGRLTEPMAWNAATDKYERCTWEQAFSDIGRQLKKLPPKDVVFEVVAATVAKDNVSRGIGFACHAVRHTGGLYRGLLPRAQSADTVMAPCRRQPSAGGEVNPGYAQGNLEQLRTTAPARRACSTQPAPTRSGANRGMRSRRVVTASSIR
jgi:hypothetical protein